MHTYAFNALHAEDYVPKGSNDACSNSLIAVEFSIKYVLIVLDARCEDACDAPAAQ